MHRNDAALVLGVTDQHSLAHSLRQGEQSLGERALDERHILVYRQMPESGEFGDIQARRRTAELVPQGWPFHFQDLGMKHCPLRDQRIAAGEVVLAISQRELVHEFVGALR